MKIAYSKKAIKFLNQAPANEKARVIDKIKTYAKTPAALANNASKLQGRDGYKLRVGGVRVIFELSADTMNILNIGHRGEIYD